MDFTFDLNQQLTFILQLTLAIIFGGLIGLNRQMEDKPAGMRTFILVCMGTTLLSIISKYHYLYINLNPNTEIVPIQLASYAIAGIGFLGGGIIYHKKDNVEGITTAASLWVVAAVGIAIGFGFYWLALYTTLAEFVIVSMLWRFYAAVLHQQKKELAAKKKK